ncbi:DMT family transporter [Salinicoccus halitifaciens]|uniref:Transporter family-2 protein n=1 Tax=Salinicoccus halitifaciens TaxID=1073415 RepID=A0ABV2EBX2_9STAP|nr:DMT family transporter [Salinicoccus halitifaciens]MCD2137415.1 DMT family transporter [Salinicoccus halitifaciens]
MYLLILLGVLGGMAVPLQTSINAEFSRFSRAVFITSFYSFLVGTIALFAMNLALNTEKFSASFFGAQDYSYIWFTGGVMGVIFLTANFVLLPRIGAALTVIVTVTGQMIIGIMIDTFGWFEAAPQPFHPMHIAGVSCLIIGIIYMNINKRLAVGEQHSRAWVFLGLFTGMIPPMQTAVNSALSLEVDSTLFAAFISFLMGTTALFFIALIVHRRLSFKLKVDGTAFKPWYFTSGLLGAVYIGMNILLMPYLGVTLTMMSAIFGQIIMGLLIDHFGLLGLPRQPVGRRRIIAVAIIVLGILILQLF